MLPSESPPGSSMRNPAITAVCVPTGISAPQPKSPCTPRGQSRSLPTKNVQRCDYRMEAVLKVMRVRAEEQGEETIAVPKNLGDAFGVPHLPLFQSRRLVFLFLL